MERYVEHNQIIYKAKRYKQCNPTGKPLRQVYGFRAQITVMTTIFLSVTFGMTLSDLFNLSDGINALVIIISTIIMGLLGWRFARFPDPSLVPHRYTITIDKAKMIVKYKRFGWRLFEPLIEFKEFPIVAISDVNVIPMQHCYVLRLFFHTARHVVIDVPSKEIGEGIMLDIEQARQLLNKDDFLNQVNYAQ